jgi:phasin family protein
MTNPVQPILNLYEAQLQASKELANIILSGAERIDRIAIEATKDGLNKQITYAQALTAVKDLQGAAVLKTAFLQPNNEQALAFYQDMLKTLAETYAGMTQTVESYLKEFSQNASGAISGAGQGAGQPTPAIAANNVLEFWNTAWRQLNAMSEQYTRAAQGGAKAEPTQATAQTAAAAATKNQPAQRPRQP